ncbi:MAG: cation:dicarboxylase symporter family transporter [Clostridia bacterium]|nr:cation:dicarboxylase symporter family transporter [Clostridia bacterium]
MRTKDYLQLHSNLQNQSIDSVSDWLSEQLSVLRTEKGALLRIRLLVEEILLRLQEYYGEETELEIYLDHPKTRPVLKLELEGKSFNPLSETNAELGDWNSSLQTAVGLTPKYTYSWGKNTLKLKIPTKKFNAVLKIFLALLVGVALGIIGHTLLPVSIQDKVVQYFLDPAYDLWLRALNAISGPIIFFTVITTMLNTKRIDYQGGDSSNVVLRYFNFSFLISASTVVLTLPFWLWKHLAGGASSSVISRLHEYYKSLVPQSILEAFSESNTPQLLLIAFVLGAALIILGNQVAEVKTIVRQINMVGLKLAEWVSLLVPFFAGIFLCLEIVEGRTHVIQGAWKPLALSLAVSVFILVAGLFYVAWRVKTKPHIIGQKVRKPFLTALKTGGLDAAFEQAKYSCIHLLGVDKHYTAISLPQGLVLYMPVSAIGTLIFTMYSAHVYQVKIDWFWLVSGIIFAVLLFVATPPVPGANLLAYVVFFQWLGIPSEALMDAMIFDIVFGIFAGAGNQFLLQIEMVLQARKIGILDYEKLRKPVPKKKKAKKKLKV